MSLDQDLRRHHESFYRDPEVDDESNPAFIAAQLRPDGDFRGELATRRFPFDDDQADAIICHVQGGCAQKVTSNDLRRAFTEGTTGDPGLDEAMLSILSEINRESLEFTLQGKIVGRLLKSKSPTDRDGYDIALALDRYPGVFRGALAVLDSDDRKIFLQAVRDASGITGRGRPVVNPSDPDLAIDPWGKAWQLLQRTLEQGEPT